MSMEIKEYVIKVSAVKVTSENIEEVAKWCNGKRVYGYNSNTEWIRLSTVEGAKSAEYGYWIIRNKAGKFYVRREEKFKDEYSDLQSV